MLTHVPEINQKEFKDLVKMSISCGSNILVLGPSGGGKTFIAQQAAEEEGCRLIYINLSVLERTDFQGFPVLSEDKKTVDYATPVYLPFADSSTKEAHILMNRAIETLNEKEDKDILAQVVKEQANLAKQDRTRILSELQKYFSSSKSDEKLSKKAADSLSSMIEEATKGVASQPLVFLFDEVDKAATETTQTLLEFLQFGSINGRKLDVRACILTGNLPDEHAHTNQISHAITKRCSTYQMKLEIHLWREWALKNGVHDNVIQFLSAEPAMLYDKAPDGDPTAYALPSPRTWTQVSDVMNKIDKDKKDVNYNLILKMVSGNVGELADTKYKVWYEFYRKWDKDIENLVEKGTHPNLDKAQAQELLIVALASASKFYSELKPGNEARIKKVAKNVYSWLATQSEDVQHSAIKMSFNQNFDIAIKYELAKIPEFISVFKKIESKMNKYNSK